MMGGLAAACFAENDPHNTPPAQNPTPNPGGNCSYSSGQYLFTTSWGEVIYAYTQNGIFYAALQNGDGFKPQHWLVATGQMTSAQATCFAENDPRSGTTANPPATAPTPANNCVVSRPRGHVDVLNNTEISGWALDEGDLSKPVTIELYVNGLKIATGQATEDRGDLVGAFGNNPAARYHGFHAKWSFNRTQDGTYTIMAKICGTDTPLRTEQVTFHYQTDPTASAAPTGPDLPEVTVSAPSLYGAGPGTIWYPTFNSGAGNGPAGSNDGSNGGNDGHAGSGGPSGGSGNRITNTLTTPCLKDVMSKMQNAKFDAAVQNILRKFSVSTTLNFTLKEGNLNNTDRNAETAGNVITLNSAALANASQEFIAKVIYHEVLHVHLGGSLNSDHQTMATNYVAPMAQTLTSLFPSLSFTEAQALSWSGLKDTNAWNTFGDAGKDQILGVATQHKNLNNNYNHQYGTSCN